MCRWGRAPASEPTLRTSLPFTPRAAPAAPPQPRPRAWERGAAVPGGATARDELPEQGTVHE